METSMQILITWRTYFKCIARYIVYASVRTPALASHICVNSQHVQCHIYRKKIASRKKMNEMKRKQNKNDVQPLDIQKRNTKTKN